MPPVLAVIIVLVLGLAGPCAWAQPTPAADHSLDRIEGFRSARFGMTMDEVLAALGQDFGAEAASGEVGVNPLERTTVLTATVPDLLPEGGPATVAYIFGHQSRRLVQINVVWEPTETTAAERERLAGDAALLQAYFTARHYVPGTVFVDRQLPDGTAVLFTASDPDGRQVTLSRALPAAPVAVEAGPARGGPAPATGRPILSLRLSYVATPSRPDVYRLPAGAF